MDLQSKIQRSGDVGYLRKKRRYSTFPLQDNIDITLGHTAPITSAFAWPFHLDIIRSN